VIYDFDNDSDLAGVWAWFREQNDTANLDRSPTISVVSYL